MNAGGTVKLWDPLRTRAIPERLRGVFTTRRYTNTRLPLPYLTFTFRRRVLHKYFCLFAYKQKPTNKRNPKKSEKPREVQAVPVVIHVAANYYAANQNVSLL